ncbi:MAG: alkaline phosphatase D family protein, partial [Actinomycetes bacterium]
ERDYTVHVDVTDLAPYTRYAYRFRALGQTSPVGRTQTAGDDGAVHALRIGFVSCSNYTGGYFTPYRYLAQRDDLDLVLHLGDYVYEYGNGDDRYGPAELAGVRDHVPDTEMVTLADYRQRHANYKSDPDLQAAHAAFPWIVIFDDHEVTNDTYDTGAENHQPETEGDFVMRRNAAYKAYLEWMPIRLPQQGPPSRGLRFWRSFSFGPLADLFVVDTRQNRTQQAPGLAGALFGVDPSVADPDRILMEPGQMEALKAALADDGAQWHLIGNQTVFTRVAIPEDLPGREQLVSLGLSTASFNTDQWDGYANDQLELLQAMAAAGGDPVVLTGDIHSSWANDLPIDPGSYAPVGPLNNSVGVEFVCPSVTSDGFTEVLGGDAQAQAATTGLQATNQHIRYLDGIGHGFSVLDVTPDRVQSDFWFISDRTDPQASLVFASAWQSMAGSRQVTQAAGPVGDRSDVPRTASAPASPTVAAPTTAARTLPETGAGAAAATAAVAVVAASALGLRAVRRPDQQTGPRPQ